MRQSPGPAYPERNSRWQEGYRSIRGVDGSWDAACGAGAKAGCMLGGFLSSPLGCEWQFLTFLRPVPVSRPSVVLVPASRSDSPMPPAAQVRRNRSPGRRHPKVARVIQCFPVSAPSPPRPQQDSQKLTFQRLLRKCSPSFPDSRGSRAGG